VSITNGFVIVVTGPDGFREVRYFPTAYCADAALRWATMLRDGYTADTAQAEAAEREAQQARMEAEEAGSAK